MTKLIKMEFLNGILICFFSQPNRCLLRVLNCNDRGDDSSQALEDHQIHLLWLEMGEEELLLCFELEQGNQFLSL
jgi:hypothetical protein